MKLFNITTINPTIAFSESVAHYTHQMAVKVASKQYRINVLANAARRGRTVRIKCDPASNLRAIMLGAQGEENCRLRALRNQPTGINKLRKL